MRSTTTRTLGALTFLALLAVGCEDKAEKKKEEEPSTKSATTAEPTTTAAPTAATTTAPTTATVADADLATPADFEEAVEQQITTKNYKTELSALEKDIEKDGT